MAKVTSAKTDSQLDPLVDERPSRYVVGIDLGTTNSAVACVDTEEQPWRVRIFPVVQLIGPGEVEPRETLPSFHYQPNAAAGTAESLQLPWQREGRTYAVGFFARDEGAKGSGRQIASAKSWLCHPGVDRTAQLLPWHGADDVERLSPVEASARYLLHIREAWDVKFPHEPLAAQDIVLTLPASFDEVARELTVQAAARAGLPRVVLIEEPQAAFYAWVYKHADDWAERVAVGQKILVCDIGGGTTDFTLISVRRSSAEDGRVQFHRIAVGNHLILGGDNLDLALAHHVEQKLTPGGKLAARQWDVLLGSCRRAKEALLGESPPETMTVNVPGSGSKLIGGGLQVEITRDEICQLLVEGFLPEVDLSAKPAQRQSGFQEFGLPYATDPAITKYLAAFLSAHRSSAEDQSPADSHDPARPDLVLFNGGFFASPVLRERLSSVLASWFQTTAEPNWTPTILAHDRLDLAVARGAAYYGMVRRGVGVRVAAALARSYYVRVAGEEPVAVCLVPGNAEPGQVFELNQPFRLTVAQPVEFQLFVSSTRLADRPGDILPIDREQMSPLPPIRTVLRTRSRSEVGEIPVTLRIQLTEVGTIEVWCHEVGSERHWRLQFDIRSAIETDREATTTSGEFAGTLDEETWNDCREIIASIFSDEGAEQPDQLIKRMTHALGMQCADWPMTLLRRIWETLMEFHDGRRKNPAHEARWLNLLGYALRPGYGLAVDDWRVTETWRTIHGKLFHATAAIRAEAFILWRRIAGGLTAGQQMALAEPLLVLVRNLHKSTTTGKTSSTAISLQPAESHEVWRLLGSFELLPLSLKIELGEMIVDLLPRRRMESVREALIWTLARLGQRVPLYGPLNSVVSGAHAESWLSRLPEQYFGTTTEQSGGINQFAVVQLARRTHDRYRDVSEEIRQLVLAYLNHVGAAEHAIKLVSEGGELDSEERNRVFGEALPSGLRLNS